jgi:hypothetical protein
MTQSRWGPLKPVGWGVVKSLELIGSGPVVLIHTQEIRVLKKQKTHFCGRKLQDHLWMRHKAGGRISQTALDREATLPIRIRQRMWQ